MIYAMGQSLTPPNGWGWTSFARPGSF